MNRHHYKKYLDDQGRLLFVHRGISTASLFRCGTFYRKKSGALKRLVNRNLPLRRREEHAQMDLDLYASERGFREIEMG